MFQREKLKRLPLKKIYYISFILLIVIPILIVLLVALLELNHQFKVQAIENIKRAQEAIIADLESDEDVMSIRLSHLVYTNNNEILKYAAGLDESNTNIRNTNERKLSQTVNLVLEPVKDIISVDFYMKDGKSFYVKNEIKHTQEQVKSTKWYQSALKKRNTVCTGFYDTKSTNDLYMGSKKDSLILVFALAPDVTTDRSQKIEMVMFYQLSDASERIRSYNYDYLKGDNKLGITQITESDGNVIYSTQQEKESFSKEYTCVKSPIKFNNSTWFIESYIKTSELTADFVYTAMWVLGAAILVLSFAGYFSTYFLRSIVKPIEDISSGLRQVEEGNLEVHIKAWGQFEIRNMIHQFNAMARRIKVLVSEYEEKIKSAEKSPEDYFASMIRGEITPEEVNKRSKEFFAERYAILGIHVDYNDVKNKSEVTPKLISSFERNPRFASRCVLYKESTDRFFVFYRITESDYSYKLVNMVENLQRMSNQEFGVRIFTCIGYKKFGYNEFKEQMEEVRSKMCFRHLTAYNSLINLDADGERLGKILLQEPNYKQLGEALYIADEKNLTQEKEKMFHQFAGQSVEVFKIQIYAAILAIGNCFSRVSSDFSDIFGQQYNYFEKIERIDDNRGLKIWITNYFAWIMEYSASKLDLTKSDPVTKAKRYMADNYENAALSLKDVAEYVGLNEKYFTNRFTKETGETFSSYLTALRIQKSRDLLKSTSFKVYEIAEMVGYYNVEHFNRTFKKLNDITPAQYRKNN